MIVEMIFFCNKEDCCKAKQDIFHLILGITIQEHYPNDCPWRPSCNGRKIYKRKWFGRNYDSNNYRREGQFCDLFLLC